jgi:hypothetical protein
MTFGIIIHGVKYIHLMNNNDFKKKSLYDNVYFTLRDIFANAESSDISIQANEFNNCLTRNMSFEYRTEKVEYTNKLHETYFVEKLKSWLTKFNIHYFKFEEAHEDEEIDMKEYMKWDDWWGQFIDLRNLIDLQYEKCCRWEEEDTGRDFDRLEELAYEDECYARGVDPIFGDECP